MDRVAPDSGEGTSRYPLDVDNNPPLILSPAMLGLQPVSAKRAPVKTPSTQTTPVLNARGVMPRIRKRNRQFFNDCFIDSKKKPAAAAKKPKKKKTRTPCDKQEETPKRTQNETAHDYHMRQGIGKKLQHLLQMPKAYRMVGYEFFYSTLDSALLAEGTFRQQVSDKFPNLQSWQLTRSEWYEVRRSLGKPRRLSPAFLLQARTELQRQRMKVRMLQMDMPCDRSFAQDLPDAIPGILPIGTQVTAKLSGSIPERLFTGTVQAIDESNFRYRIGFDRCGIDSRSVPDFEVAATNDAVATLSVYEATWDLRHKLRGASFFSSTADNPLLGGRSSGNIATGGVVFPRDNIGGFPIDLLELMVRTKKTLRAKQMKLLRLQNINDEAQIYRSCNTRLPNEFQHRYAVLLIALDKLNDGLQRQMRLLHERSNSLIADEQLSCMLVPTFMREQCRHKAGESYQRHNSNVTQKEPIAKLIKDLITILHMTAKLGKGRVHNGTRFDTVRVLKDFMTEVKTKLDESNWDAFERNVELPINRIAAGYQSTIRRQEAERAKSNPVEESEPDPSGNDFEVM